MTTESLLKSRKKKKKKFVQVYSRAERQQLIQEIFKSHIGRKNEISQKELFLKIYGELDNYSDLQIWFLWCQIRQDMNWLRKTTFCFIGCRKNKNRWCYYVIKDEKDAQYYIDILNNTIKKCKFMIKRCNKAVEDEFYKKFKK